MFFLVVDESAVTSRHGNFFIYLSVLVLLGLPEVETIE